ncbi:MAG: HEPN domain-containing protein [Planctomycetes bacterium]|nr:HEPN domain-containing protein [Planctomycetota bacterium]
MFDPRHESQRWLEQARRDLEDTRYSEAGNRHNLACFLSQQAAEKALKAYLYAQGNAVVWGHSVDELCRKSTPAEPGFEILRRKAGKLDRFYIPTRYPNGIPGGIPADSFDDQDSNQALSLAQEVTILSRLA